MSDTTATPAVTLDPSKFAPANHEFIVGVKRTESGLIGLIAKIAGESRADQQERIKVLRTASALRVGTVIGLPAGKSLGVPASDSGLRQWWADIRQVAETREGMTLSEVADARAAAAKKRAEAKTAANRQKSRGSSVSKKATVVKPATLADLLNAMQGIDLAAEDPAIIQGMIDLLQSALTK